MHMDRLRPFLFMFIGIALGVILALGAAYAFAKNAAGQAMLRDFLVAQNKAALAAQPAFAPQAASSTPPATLPVPAAYATEEYFVAINSVIQDLYALNTVNLQLGPLLDQLNRQTLSCSYAGFYELMGQAHKLANKNQTLVSQLGFHLSALATANAKSKDIITKAGTQALVTEGSAFTAALQEYAALLNQLLIGDTPTAEQVSGFQAQVNAVAGASQKFADELKPLLQHIADGDRAIINAAASSTPAR